MLKHLQIYKYPIIFAVFFTIGLEPTKVLNVEPESTFFFMPTHQKTHLFFQNRVNLKYY